MATIELHQLTLGYQDVLFKPADISFPDHQISLLFGSSGCGKSTLLRYIAQFGKHSESLKVNGQITIDHQNINTIPLKQRRQLITMLFQNPRRQFTMPTGRQEIQFALENLQTPPEQIASKITAALQFTGVAYCADQAIDTLSGGEQQKMALAVIIAMNSQIILLDEPFASVDSQSRDELLAALKRLNQQQRTTIVIIDHNLAHYENLIDQLFQIQEQTILNIPKAQWSKLLAPFQSSLHFVPINRPAPKSAILTFDPLKIQTSQRTLIHQDHFAWPQNAISVLVGDNGVGKSTLFKAITKEISYEGIIQFKGRNIKNIKTASYLRQVAMVFQDAETQFLRLTVQEEIQLSMHQTRKNWYSPQQVKALLQQLDLMTHLDQIVYSLSAGQQRKLQILSMLIMGNDVLLMDEPFAGIDYQSIQVLTQIIRHAQHRFHQTIIIITHQITGMEKLIDHLVQFKDHQLKEVGVSK